MAFYSNKIISVFTQRSIQQWDRMLWKFFYFITVSEGRGGYGHLPFIVIELPVYNFRSTQDDKAFSMWR